MSESIHRKFEVASMGKNPEMRVPWEVLLRSIVCSAGVCEFFRHRLCPIILMSRNSREDSEH